MFEIDQVIAASKYVHTVEGQVIQLDDHHEMISTGWSNPTPWKTHREEPEEALRQRIDPMLPQVKDHAQCRLQPARAALRQRTG